MAPAGNLKRIDQPVMALIIDSRGCAQGNLPPSETGRPPIQDCASRQVVERAAGRGLSALSEMSSPRDKLVRSRNQLNLNMIYRRSREERENCR